MNNVDTAVPRPMLIATAWAWRLLLLGIAVFALLLVLQKFLALLLPVFIAALLASVTQPMVKWLQARGLKHKLASVLVFIGTLAAVSLLLYFVGAQIVANSGELKDQAVEGIGQVQTWLVQGPLHLNESQITDATESVQNFIQHPPKSALTMAAGFGGTLSNILAGALIAAFALFFFISDGARIGAWLVRLFPRTARDRADSSGRVAWNTLTNYTQATTLVAFVDSLGIMLVAWLLGLPLILPIGVLVFLGSFIPMIGGLVTGMLAVLIALVSSGPTEALFMLAGVIAVQQIEGNLLQPLIMGKFVSVHPLAVLLGLSAGFTLAGVPGAFVAVPIIAVINAVALHLSGNLAVGEDSVESLDLAPEELENELSEHAESTLLESEEPADASTHDATMQDDVQARSNREGD